LEEEKMWSKRKNQAVSEIVGTVLLLGIAIAMFALVQLFAFGLLNENPNSPSVRLIGSYDDTNIIIFHNGGESLPSNTKILFTINGANTRINVSDDDYFYLNESNSKEPNNGKWDIGEKIEYPIPPILLPVNSLSVTVVDVSSNSVIMSATIKE